MVATSDLKTLYSNFKKAFVKGDAETCVRTLPQLKLKLAEATALALADEAITASAEQLTIARDVLEHAVFLAVQMRDEAMFERNFSQAKTFYAATRYGWISMQHSPGPGPGPCCCFALAAGLLPCHDCDGLLCHRRAATSQPATDRRRPLIPSPIGAAPACRPRRRRTCWSGST